MRILVSVISDLVSDQRVHKVCTYLHQKGYHVQLIGRRFADSVPLEKRNYETLRIKCYFKQGMLQYAEFNLKLFLILIVKKADLFLANDLDTLAPNYIHAVMRGKKLVYDSHEYFTGTPELQHKPLKKRIWKSLEAWLLPKINDAYTVNDSIADLYKQQYGIAMKVVRNVPFCNRDLASMEAPLFPADKFILLLQGAGINNDRGAEELIESMQLLPSHFLLVLIGSGNAWEQLQQKTVELGLAEKVKFIPKVPFSILHSYTRQAHLGLSLDKPTCLNYALSLPNKVFDYIQAGVPVLASAIVEVKRIIDRYNIGMNINEITPQAIADAVLWIYENSAVYEQWKQNNALAARDFCWETEQLVLDEIYDA
jgi:glycosyltransferase involved in cell wall biosynthesis